MLRHLIAVSDLDTVLHTPIRSAALIEPWAATRITLLGDAIHSIPPTGGIGANTATFAGDKAYFDAQGTDFRLNDDWKET